MATILLLVSCLVYSVVVVDSSVPTCVSVMTKYRAKGLLQSDVPSQAVADSSLKICSSKSSGCCTKRMEDSFSSLARSEFESSLVRNTNGLTNTFANSAKIFDVFFVNLIKNGEKDLHKMFLKTYGNFYEQRAHVFSSLFADLNSYYKGKNSDLTQVMNDFFANLMRQMFLLLNSQFQLTPQFLQCTTKHMDELKPFGDMKDKITSQVKRSFVAARAFVYGLNVGHSVLRQLQAITASKECEKEIIKMSYCSWCLGKTDLKPCQGFCTDSYKVCFSGLKDLADEWENFMSALLDMVTKLEGPFSIENVLDPIGVKISFAIMNFQERSSTVTKKVFTGCGIPPSKAKSKRSTDTSDFTIDEPNKGKVKRQVSKDPANSKTLLTELAKLTFKFRDDIKPARGFWTRLPTSICAPPTSSDDSSQCWNGTSIGTYTSPGVSINNIDSSLGPSSDIINHQVKVLKTMTSRLKSALEGEDVNIIKVPASSGEGEEGSGSGSGSGSASGENEIPTIGPTQKIITNGNEIDGDDMLGGGVNNNNKDGNVLGKRSNSGNILSSSYGFTGLLVILFLISRLC